MLEDIANQYHVQPQYILAILGIESNYGTNVGSHSVFDVVSTSAYDSRRSKRQLNELLASFRILDNGDATYEKMKSSWGGALGYPQFLASSFLNLAIDQDNDGIKDLWSIGPDVIASVGNYLHLSAWVDGQSWGNEVFFPADFNHSSVGIYEDNIDQDPTCQRYHSLGPWRTLPQWQSLGVYQPDASKSLPKDSSLSAALVITDRSKNKGYLVYHNFCSLLSYNPSIKYALRVGILSDAIRR